MTSVLDTPAKINLFLRVGGRRQDGYHDIETLFYPLRGLSDTVQVDDRVEPGIVVECDHPGVPGDRHNLAWLAAERFAEIAHIDPAWRIAIEKRIPVAAGLGGGSSDAAAVLQLLNRAYDNLLTADVLKQIAAQLGADVPFFLDPKPAVGTGIGEVLLPVDCPENLQLVLVNPGFPVSTRWAYTHAVKNEESAPALSQLIGVLGNPTATNLAGRLYNSFEKEVGRKFPLINMLRDFLRDCGASAAHMSGSGPTVFGVFDRAVEAEDAAKAVREKFGAKYWVWCSSL